jgi:hypothetical protein
VSSGHKFLGRGPEYIAKLQDSKGWSYVEERTANSKKASMLLCGKIPSGGPKGTIFAVNYGPVVSSPRNAGIKDLFSNRFGKLLDWLASQNSNVALMMPVVMVIIEHFVKTCNNRIQLGESKFSFEDYISGSIYGTHRLTKSEKFYS